MMQHSCDNYLDIRRGLPIKKFDSPLNRSHNTKSFNFHLVIKGISMVIFLCVFQCLSNKM